MHIVFIVLIIIIAAGYVIYRSDKKKVDTILKKLALERDGKIKSTFGGYPQLTFQYNDVDILLSAMSGGTGGTEGASGDRPPQTFAQFHFIHLL